MIFQDTIAAISTPIGEGGISIIRISGGQAKTIGLLILRTAKGLPFKDFTDHRLYYGKVIDPQKGQLIDEALFFYSRAPHSFTAEDTIEIQAHGGMVGISEILAVILQNGNGVRLAEPGEFTKRAYLNGRIDLVQAESIIDLIRAKTEKAHQIALSQLTGEATKEINTIEDQLYRVLIAIEAVLDFPEEGIPEMHRDHILDQTAAITRQLEYLLQKIDEGRKIREGLMIVIVGRPNVGKSSLLNTFLQEERAIVTEIPGTTRDIIEAQIQIQGIPVRLVDTAGIRRTENPIEQIGIQKAEQYLGEADLILFILDGGEPLTDEDRAILGKLQERPALIVINKADLPQQIQPEQFSEFEPRNIITLSLQTKQGFDQLLQRIIERVGIGEIAVDDRPLLSRIRHKHALERGLAALKSFTAGLAAGTSEDLLAVDLRCCLEAIGEISGKKVSDEVIHGIFAQFCIGK
ncbi:MAG TPA: tRNA uridine-5-carboxymethylaminomethyl(34) synthesis GTPase MnmE [Firmicutes bacterium]|jgi:tRNA modification GTPase|nr:tRNA uridine-5-carboxymethylaminomethyl(34) synthesis GTPase MnmE [Bacillota bacterium]